MSEHPIIFSGAMVRAILDGRKTQTRRVISRWRYPIVMVGPAGTEDDPASWGWPTQDGDYALLDQRLPRSGHEHRITSPYGVPGDVLWVRETWALAFDRVEHAGKEWIYAADPGPEPFRWRSPIHMPRKASRLTLRVTDVRAERLHAITEAEAKAEGVEDRTSFASGWDSINGKRAAWTSNPWIWVVTFEPKEEP